MKKYIEKVFAIFVTIFIVGTCIGNSNFTNVKANAQEGKKSTIWVIGDSTVSSFNDNYYYPRYGYGTQIANYFDSNKYEVKNLALSGRSSKSYVLDPEYKTLLEGMSNGDFLIIGFGHNDEKLEQERYTNPNGSYTDAGSFQNSLYENYIKKADEKGCKTILCTPIVRRTDSDSFTSSQLHVTTTEGEYEGGDYPQAIRDLGQALNLPVVDMTELTRNLYEKLGSKNTVDLHAWTSSNPASVDNTHTNIWGAKYNAYLVSKTIKELNIAGLSEGVIDSTIASAPTKEANLVSNPEYVEFKYDPNLKNSEIWSDIGIWKGTVFGNVGEPVTNENFTLGQDDKGDMNISVRRNKGKIASTADGVAMYYYKVPAKSTFTLTATAKVNSYNVNNQVSFGLMARDDMYIDEYTQNSLGDYVAAAPLNLKSKTPWNCFARKSGVLTKGSEFTNTTFEEGTSVDLKIQSNSDGYACTVGKETAITGGFDFALTSVDPNYVYVGMFVARNADVTFSNVKLIVDGKEVTANKVNDEVVDDKTSIDNKDDLIVDDTPTPAEPTNGDDANLNGNGEDGNEEEVNQGSQNSEAAKTSDNAAIRILVIALLLSAGSIAVLGSSRKKKANF